MGQMAEVGLPWLKYVVPYVKNTDPVNMCLCKCRSQTMDQLHHC